jgi:hypothetical protein
MKKQGFIFVFLFGILLSAPAQEVVWKVGVHSFFDNMEFSGSSVQNSQTMAGVHLAPEIGLSWNDKHRIYVGADWMHEYGSNKIVDYYDPVIYYKYDNKPFRFYMGAIPRQLVLDKYPRMFFQDSIRNYRPTITGLFWEYESNENYANIWLDWASRQTDTRHEAFFMGWSGRYNWGVGYAQHLGYMFHLAGLKNPVIPEAVHDNGLLLTSVGIDLAVKTGLDKLEANAGWSVGMDRDRDIAVWNKPQGLLSEIKVEYQGLGLFNTYYKGGSQQVYYGDHGNELYWGDPVYRSKEYDRVDGYILFLKTNVVQLKLVYSLHFVEKQLYHSQAFYATFDLDKLKNKKAEKKYRYLWDDWF